MVGLRKRRKTIEYNEDEVEERLYTTEEEGEVEEKRAEEGRVEEDHFDREREDTKQNAGHNYKGRGFKKSDRENHEDDAGKGNSDSQPELAGKSDGNGEHMHNPGVKRHSLSEDKKKKVGKKNHSIAQKNALPPLKVANAFVGDTALLVATRKSKEYIGEAVKGWVSRYKANKVKGTAEAAEFLIQACGITSMPISEEDVEHTSSDELKEKADEIAKSAGLEDVLGGRGGKQIKENYQEIWDKIVREAGLAGLLDDGYFLDKIINLNIALSTSVIREFRRVATITVSQISISILVLVANMSDIREVSASQANKTASNTSKTSKNARASAFADQTAKAAESIRDLLAYLDSVFQSIYTTRFRDVDSGIRATIVTSLGSWMLSYPSTFLSSAYLKYLAWALSDKDSPVRLSAVTSITKLYKDEANVVQLKDFTTRFSDRIVELMDDKDDGVAVAGTELITLLVRQGQLKSNIGQHVFNLLSDPSQRIRGAAAELAAGMVMELGRQTLPGGKASMLFKKGKKKNGASASDYELAGVLSILRSLSIPQEEGSHIHKTLSSQTIFFVVSSLSDKLPVLKDWSVMIAWLKNDTAVKLYESEEAAKILALCLLSSMKAALGLHNCQQRDKKAARDATSQEITLLMQKELPSLVIKFQANADISATLAKYIRQLKLSLYSLRKQESDLGKLLHLIKDAFFKHSDSECAFSCAKSIAWSIREGKGNIKDLAKAVMVQCAAQVASDVCAAVRLISEAGPNTVHRDSENMRKSDGEVSEILFALQNSVTKAAALSEAFPPALQEHSDAIDALDKVLQYTSEGWDIPSSVVFGVEKSLLLNLTLLLSSISEDSDDHAINNLVERRSDMTSRIHVIIESALSDKRYAVAAKSAAILADIFTIFHPNNIPSYCGGIAYIPIDEEIESFFGALENYIVANDSVDLRINRRSNDSIELNALEILARVCATDTVPQYKQLAAMFLSYWESPQMPGDSESLFKDVLKRLKILDSTCLPEVYYKAMRASYQRYVKRLESIPEINRDEVAEEAIQPFISLSAKLASIQAAMNAPASTLAHIAEKGALWAIEREENLEFLQGASFFVVRVKGDSASSILAKLEATGKSLKAPDYDSEDEDLGDWILYHEYCDVLRSRAQMSKEEGGLKKTSRTRPRKISFAADEEFNPKVTPSSSVHRRSRRLSDQGVSPDYREKYADDEEDPLMSSIPVKEIQP